MPRHQTGPSHPMAKQTSSPAKYTLRLNPHCLPLLFKQHTSPTFQGAPCPNIDAWLEKAPTSPRTYHSARWPHSTQQPPVPCHYSCACQNLFKISPHPLPQNVVRHQESVGHGHPPRHDLQELVVRHHQHGVSGLPQLGQPRGRLPRSLPPLELEGFGYDSYGDAPHAPRRGRDHRRRTGPRSAAHTFGKSSRGKGAVGRGDGG